MKDFKSNNRFNDRGGNDRFSGKDSGQSRSWGGSDRGNRDQEMFRAVCADCGNSCEVPFKPNGQKPVYCSACFTKNGGPGERNDRNDRGGNDRFPRKDYSSPAPFKSRAEDRAGTSNTMANTLAEISIKLDRLIGIMEKGAGMPKSAVMTPSTSEVTDMPTKKAKPSATPDAGALKKVVTKALATKKTAKAEKPAKKAAKKSSKK